MDRNQWQVMAYGNRRTKEHSKSFWSQEGHRRRIVATEDERKGGACGLERFGQDHTAADHLW